MSDICKQKQQVKVLPSSPSRRTTTASWRKILLFAIVSISAFSENSLAFTSRNLIAVPAQFQTSIGSNNNNNNRYNPTRQHHTRETRQRRGALSYPIGTSPLDQNSNNSWAEIISQSPTHESDHDKITTFDKMALAGMFSFVAASLMTLLKFSSPGSWRYFLAGGICAALSHAIPTPLDVVKTRKQIDPALADKTFLDVSREILKTEGMGALWAGLGPTAWGYLFEGSIKFGVYEALKPVIKTSLASFASATSMAFLNSQILAFILCGTASGLAASVMVCPMEALRIRMVADPHFSRGGMVAFGCKIMKREGISGLAKGFNPMVLKQVPYTITKNVSFDLLTRFCYSIIRAQGRVITATTAFTVPLVSAAIASVLSCISSQPGDMVLSVVNAGEGDRKSREIFRSILASDRGIGGLFVGFKTRMLHVGVIVTLQLLIYDYVKRLVGIAATGSL